ncbi:MAG: hypothetical protein GXO78_11325 [Calditrichaeota bacterium]|nr:hypothetical protein [Calditrichota bacterium]
MKPIRAYFLGLKRIWQVKRYIGVIYLINLLLALGLGSLVGQAIYRSLGKSLAAERLVQGFDPHWYGSFSATAQGLARTFHPAVVGIGAVFENLNQFLTGRLFSEPGIFVWLGLLYLLVWTFFSAGFVSRFVRPDDPEGFWQSAARFMPRFVILAIMAGIGYYFLLGGVLNGLGGWIRSLTRETTDERVVFFLTLVKYLAVWILVWWLNMIFDYSRIATVYRDLRMVWLAPIEAFGLTLRHPLKTGGLYYLLGTTGLLVLLGYWMTAPGAGQSTATAVWMAFLFGQLYVIFRMGLRVWFYSSQTEMYLSLRSATNRQSKEDDL